MEKEIVNAEQKHIDKNEQLTFLEKKLKEAIQNAPTPSLFITKEEKENE